MSNFITGSGISDETLGIQEQLNYANPGDVLQLQPRTYYTSSPIVIPNNVALVSPARGMGIPIGNYGVSGLPVTGTIIKPLASFSGSAVILMQDNGSQCGGQQIRGITIDCSSLPSGNTVHGIQSVGAIAGVTMRDLLVYGGSAAGGNGLDAQKGAGVNNPDFWDVTHCKFSGFKGMGAHLVALADSYFLACESTGNTGDCWNITNGSNCRYLGSKAEGSTAGWGWNLIGTWGSTGYAEHVCSTASSNSSGDFQVSGTGTGTYYFNTCHASSTTTWSYSGTNTVKSSASYNTSTSAPTLA